MTGHNNTIQSHNPSFLTTLQATLDILDDVSGAIPENTYLTLTNNLQQLYNIHTSNSNTTSNSTSNANPPITTPINYTRTDYISDISYASLSNFDISNNNTNNNINNYTRTDYIGDIVSNFDIIISNTNTNTDTANTDTANNNNINTIINENIRSLNEESNRIGYSTRTRLALYGNVFNNIT